MTLATKRCAPCEGGVSPLPREQIERLMAELVGWEVSGDGKSVAREVKLDDYYQVIAFVNAVAWMAHRENHHPDLEVSYQRCIVRYTTHAIGGLSENDFICAAKVDALLALDDAQTECALP